MPLKPGKSREVVSENIREFHKGKTYRRTEARQGKKKADRQAVAVALASARRNPAKRSEHVAHQHHDSGGGW